MDLTVQLLKESVRPSNANIKLVTGFVRVLKTLENP